MARTFYETRRLIVGVSMRKTVKIFTSPFIFTVVIYLLLIQYLILKGGFEVYRFSEHQYIYKYSKLISRVCVYIGLLLSLLSPLIIWLQTKNNLKKFRVILAIAFLPAFYHILLFILSKPN